MTVLGGRAPRRVTAPVAFLLLSLAVVRAGWVEERDPYWQVRAGTENLAGLPLVRLDSWSWDPVEVPFVQTSPGWNVVLATAWDGAGFAGFFLVSLASITTYLWVVSALARQLGARPLPAVLGFGPVLALAMAFLSPRASLVAQTLFLAAVLAADRWRGGTSGESVAALGIVLLGVTGVTALGAWVHLSWLLLAPALATSCTVLWATRGGWSVRHRLALTVMTWIGAVVGVLAGPYGLDAITYSRRVQEACEGVITEWITPFTPALALRWLPAAALALGLVLWALRWCWHRRHTVLANGRVSLVLALLCLGGPAAVGGLIAIRFIGVALLALAPVAALSATRWADSVAHRLREQPPRGMLRNARARFWAEGRRWPAVLWGVLAVLSPLILLGAAQLSRPQPESSLVDALPEGCRLLSTPSAAGPVLLLRPDVTVWWDGRVDYYGRERNIRNIQLLSAANPDDAVVRRATCILLDQQGEIDVTKFADGLDSSSDWRRVAESGSGTVWLPVGMGSS